MPDVTWAHPGLYVILNQIPRDLESLVDVGCGRGIVGALCRIYREPGRLVGIDIHEPYLDSCRQLNLYDECNRWDLRRLPLPFGDKEFHVCACVEVLEHLPRHASEALVDELERIGQRVVITTPNIFLRQPAFDDNPHQEHLSQWAVRDFRRRGYTVYGVGGLRVFGRSLKYVSALFGPWTRPLPQLSTLLLCVKGS